MVYRVPSQAQPTFGGLIGPPARDLVALLIALFVTYALQFFASTAWLPALLRLSPAVWQMGFVWQLFSYPFVGFGPPSLWFLLELLILFMFGNQVFFRLGRRRFWQLLAGVAAAAAVVAVLVAIASGAPAAPFSLMQGQRMLMAIFIAAFATVWGNATILLFFVLPIKARWFLWIEVAVAFIAYLSTRDLPGLAGICSAVAATFLVISGPGQRRTIWLRLERLWLQGRLRMRRRPRLRLVDRDPSDRWVH
jgi:membrane associated rhomboid family serine protease